MDIINFACKRSSVLDQRGYLHQGPPSTGTVGGANFLPRMIWSWSRAFVDHMIQGPDHIDLMMAGVSAENLSALSFRVGHNLSSISNIIFTNTDERLQGHL